MLLGYPAFVAYLYAYRIARSATAANIDNIKIAPMKKWDGNWHLVCYDIPEDFKKERDFFRSKLLLSGFRIIQDSLLVYPYDCKEEIAIMSQKLGISPYVAYLNTDYLPKDDMNFSNYGHLYPDPYTFHFEKESYLNSIQNISNSLFSDVLCLCSTSNSLFFIIRISRSSSYTLSFAR